MHIARGRNALRYPKLEKIKHFTITIVLFYRLLAAYVMIQMKTIVIMIIVISIKRVKLITIVILIIIVLATSTTITTIKNCNKLQ